METEEKMPEFTMARELHLGLVARKVQAMKPIEKGFTATAKPAGNGKYKCRFDKCPFHTKGFEWPGQLAAHMNVEHPGSIKNYGKGSNKKATRAPRKAKQTVAMRNEYQRRYRLKLKLKKQKKHASLETPKTNGHTRPPMPFKFCPDCAAKQPSVAHKGMEIPQAVKFCFECGYRMPLVNV